MTWQKVAKGKATDRDTLELVNLVAEFREHPANLAILAFIENHFEHRALLVLTAKSHTLGVDFAFGQTNPLAQAIEELRGRHTGHLNQVFLLDSIARVGQEIRKLAVVRQQDEPFARAIESPNGKETTIARHQIYDPRPTSRVVVGGHHADRFVQDVHHAAGVRQPFTIHTNILGPRVDLRAERGDNLTIDLDPSGSDQLLAGAATSKPGRSQHLLQPLESVVITTIADMGWCPWTAPNGARFLAERRTTMGFFGTGHEHSLGRPGRWRIRGAILHGQRGSARFASQWPGIACE